MVNPLFAGAALLLLSSAAVAETPGPLQRDEIVVIGASLAELEADLARCAAGGCTVRQDVIAAVRYAEAQFRTGNYHAARKALARSVARTRKHADSDPFAVAELQTARATIAWHFGDQREAMRATNATSRLLDGHAPQSANALLARMRLISAHANASDTMNTRDRLDRLADDARAANLPSIALRADLWRAAILHREGNQKQAQALLDSVMASTDPQTSAMHLAAQILSMRLAARSGDVKAAEALIARLSEDQKRFGPVLVWAPKLPTPRGGEEVPVEVAAGLDPRGSDYMNFRWVDIGFSIGADGLVEDVEVLRGSPEPGWAQPLTSVIAQRRYTPAASPDDIAGRYRVERYTLTSDFIVPKGSLIRRRIGKTRIEQIDLTAAPPVATLRVPAPSPS